VQHFPVPGSQHFPVMVRECLEFLGLQPDQCRDDARNGVILDSTAGLGGHTAAIAARLQELGGTGWVLACDRDAESLALARAKTEELGSRIRFRQALFSQMEETLASQGISQLDGVLADLGVSRYQLTGGERGFSLMADGPLDMRMSRGEGQTAADLVNYESEGNLANLIYGLGEERRSRQIARAIVRARPITTTLQLAKLIEGVVPRTGKIHPATQTFMALRMAVNRELEELDALLALIPRVVKPGGRAVVITFMSIEDRKVKQSFQAMAKAGQVRPLNRHVVRPTEEEIRENPPSRSAKLRALELL
jgi:16S rRNA (cytosine1402-N4)-methyltransferase